MIKEKDNNFVNKYAEKSYGIPIFENSSCICKAYRASFRNLQKTGKLLILQLNTFLCED